MTIQDTGTESQREKLSDEPVPFVLPDRDVRRKRPPFLSFLLRLETLRRAGRVVSLLALDFVGVAGSLFTALALKLALQGQPRLVGGATGDQALHAVRVPDHGADVRPWGPVRGSAEAPRAVPDRVGAVPDDDHLAGVRAGQRRALLQLLHLLRLVVLRRGVHLRAPRAASSRHWLDARAGRVRAASAAGGLGQAHRSGSSCARGPVADARRHRRLHLADAATPERSALARHARGAPGGARTGADPRGDHRRPRVPARASR